MQIISLDGEDVAWRVYERDFFLFLFFPLLSAAAFVFLFPPLLLPLPLLLFLSHDDEMGLERGQRGEEGHPDHDADHPEPADVLGHDPYDRALDDAANAPQAVGQARHSDTIITAVLLTLKYKMK